MPHLVNKCCYFSRGDSVDAKNGITVKSVENDISWCVSENTFSHFSGLGFRLTQRGARGAGRGARVAGAGGGRRQGIFGRFLNI